MNHSDRVRRAGIVCCHCARNAAYYRAGRRKPQNWNGEDFWRNANSNFLDIAVLEWCKLFADTKGKHHWKKVVKDQDNFMSGLLASIGMSQIDFDSYIKKCKFYRDKFLAHLDEELVMHIPDLTAAIDSATYLHNLLVSENPDVLDDAPSDLAKFYKQRYKYAAPKYPDGT
jgi:hypothetical protein